MLEDNAMPDDPKIAAKEADPVALMKLGDAYARGIGVIENPQKARECYIKAAEGGLLRAQRLVAVAFETVERDIATAAKWYQRCAEQGDAECAGRLAGDGILDVVQLVLRGALGPILLGLLIGLRLTLAAGRFLGDQLYGTNPYNPVVTLAAVLALGLSALVAAFIPAFRATVVSPLDALRTE